MLVIAVETLGIGLENIMGTAHCHQICCPPLPQSENVSMKTTYKDDKQKSISLYRLIKPNHHLTTKKLSTTEKTSKLGAMSDSGASYCTVGIAELSVMMCTLYPSCNRTIGPISDEIRDRTFWQYGTSVYASAPREIFGSIFLSYLPSCEATFGATQLVLDQNIQCVAGESVTQHGKIYQFDHPELVVKGYNEKRMKLSYICNDRVLNMPR